MTTIRYPGEASTHGSRHDNDRAFIGDISILPTQQEIQSSQAEYVPSLDPGEWHMGGLEGLLDSNFRSLREDKIGQIRDTVKVELRRLQHSQANGTQAQPQNPAHIIMYNNINVEYMMFEPHRGIEVVLRFDQPAHLRNMNSGQRRDWWMCSERLNADTLICLCRSDGSSQFFTVLPEPFRPTHSRPTDAQIANIRLHEDNNLWDSSSEARVIVRPAKDSEIDVIISHDFDGNTWADSLIEFPDIWLSSFQPTLEVLQNMSRTLDVPFADILNPAVNAANRVPSENIDPPYYATKPGFHFNLAAITQNYANILFVPWADRSDTKRELERLSSMAPGQIKALLNALSSRLHTIKCPLASERAIVRDELIRTLLSNAVSADLGPILYVTFSNHKLDQYMELLLDAGISQLVRVGGGSTSERLRPFDLRTISQSEAFTDVENAEQQNLNAIMWDITIEMNKILKFYVGQTKQEAVEEFLQRFHRDRYLQLLSLFEAMDVDGRFIGYYHTYGLVELWLEEDAAEGNAPRSIAELQNVHVADMNKQERIAQYQSWEVEMKDCLLNRVTDLQHSFSQAKEAEKRLKIQKDLRAMRQASVIGVTLSGLAKNTDLLSRVNAKVVICDEADRTTEARLLTALLPSVQHAVLIGHNQLGRR